VSYCLRNVRRGGAWHFLTSTAKVDTYASYALSDGYFLLGLRLSRRTPSYRLDDFGFRLTRSCT
jgi:hypothetical protein